MRFLSKKQVCALVALGPTQIGRLEKDGKFPERMALPSAEPAPEYSRYSRVVWVESEVFEWMKAQLAKRGKTTMPTP
jgi:predicted DNA-binding transcriptional regulator AlpA